MAALGRFRPKADGPHSAILSRFARSIGLWPLESSRKRGTRSPSTIYRSGIVGALAMIAEIEAFAFFVRVPAQWKY